jgi:hypothetical protein
MTTVDCRTAKASQKMLPSRYVCEYVYYVYT